LASLCLQNERTNTSKEVYQFIPSSNSIETKASLEESKA